MSNEYVISESSLISIADAIRAKGNTSDPISFPSGFISTIQDIQTATPLPQFTYSVANGYTTERDEATGNWKIRFLKSGKLTFTSAPPPIDIFVVGGGGGSAGHDGLASTTGGGGYTTTKIGYQPNINTEYTITIGAGGSAGSTTGDGGRGGTSKVASVSTDGVLFSVSAAGGYGGAYVAGTGGKGGSGGNGYGTNKPGAIDGAAGYSGSYAGVPYDGGTGQGTTTREFGESDGMLYASGGATDATGCPGSANTGNGGGMSQSHSAASGASGGSGIVVIRGSL